MPKQQPASCVTFIPDCSTGLQQRCQGSRTSASQTRSHRMLYMVEHIKPVVVMLYSTMTQSVKHYDSVGLQTLHLSTSELILASIQAPTSIPGTASHGRLLTQADMLHSAQAKSVFDMAVSFALGASKKFTHTCIKGSPHSLSGHRCSWVQHISLYQQHTSARTSTKGCNLLN